ncbi:hypothetical protein CDAR_62651 [Caerostris darwini]|uniref:Uncharacterized protein n=1 Tax=Caerostris darwini TaxID=1538125 RepID=A0AAV4UF68_9ARAC|nr:hypothetical protein CDAR_62651 [Caerostris darwini]
MNRLIRLCQQKKLKRMLHSVLNNPEFESFPSPSYLTRVSHCSLHVDNIPGVRAIRAGRNTEVKGNEGGASPPSRQGIPFPTTAAGKTAPLFTSLKTSFIINVSQTGGSH